MIETQHFVLGGATACSLKSLIRGRSRQTVVALHEHFAIGPLYLDLGFYAGF